jgi:hypothetical protein
VIALHELAWAYQRRTPSFKALPLRDLKLRLASISRLPSELPDALTPAFAADAAKFSNGMLFRLMWRFNRAR